MNLGLFPIEAKNLIEMLHRLGMAAHLIAQKTDHSPPVHVVRPLTNDVPEQLLRLIGSAGLIGGDRLHELCVHAGTPDSGLEHFSVRLTFRQIDRL
jgi:hypothetical protein